MRVGPARERWRHPVAKPSVAWVRRPGACGTLDVVGRLRPGWCGRLATHLAERGIDIRSGRAVKETPGWWRAHFDLRRLPEQLPARDALGDVLCAPSQPGFAAPIAVLAYELATSETRGGCLFLAIEGRDRVGFLAALLHRLAYLALFPVELRLTTAGAQVRDRLWLRGGGDRVPPPSAAAALAASLDALVQNSRAIQPG